MERIAEGIQNSKELFKARLINNLEKLDRQKPVKLIATGAEGPLICFVQDEERLFYLQVHHGKNKDYRPEFMELAREVLKENNF